MPRLQHAGELVASPAPLGRAKRSSRAAAPSARAAASAAARAAAWYASAPLPEGGGGAIGLLGLDAAPRAIERHPEIEVRR